jgi:hypothetical protein
MLSVHAFKHFNGLIQRQITKPLLTGTIVKDRSKTWLRTELQAQWA